jgi:hypothetical protein
MAASAGSMIMVGKSRTFVIDLYIPDAIATDITFSPSGLAVSTSPATFRVPEDVVINEVILSAAAPTAVGAIITVNGAVINGGTWKHSNCLSTLATRLKMNVPVRAGDFIGARQY